jgi:hypothetical protein
MAAGAKLIATVEPSRPFGGVRTWIAKVVTALRLEGFSVDRYVLDGSLVPGSRFFSMHISDLLRHLRLQEYGVLLYFGSLPYLGYLLDKLKGIPVMVSVSGHPVYELPKAVTNAGTIHEKVGASLVWRYARLAYYLDMADMWICHTLTACEEIRVADRGNYVLLKQFVLPHEVAFYDRVYRWLKGERGEKREVRIFAYLSYADLPGLKLWSLLRIFNRVRRRVKRRVTFVVEDPRIKRTIKLGDAIQITGRMPQPDFLRILGTSDLYIETSIDEELRLTALDAMFLRVPVAKILHPTFYGRQDYTEDEILIGTSADKLVELIAEYINNFDHYHEYFSRTVYEFVKRKRLWDVVKVDFMQALDKI